MAAGAWDALFARGAPYHGPAPAPFFASFLPAGARVLDLGCGAGKSLAALRAAGDWELLGLDASRPALARARRFSEVVLATATTLPLRAGGLDAVRIHHLLGHLAESDLDAVAREVARCVKPGGWLEVHAFARGDLRDGVGRPVGARAFERGGIVTRYFEEGELRARFSAFEGEERVHERAVRFASRPRRILTLHARRR